MTKIGRCLSVLETYLQDNNIAFLRVLSSVLCGSNSYNLALKDSDEDYLGVYLETPHRHYSLSGSKGSYMVHGDIDLCIYEFGFYVKLLFKGNPKVIEHLLCEKDAYRDPLWSKHITPNVVVNVINKVTFAQYFSFARNRISLSRESESGSRERVKLQANAIRLLSESQRLYSGKLPEVTLTGEFRDLLLSIRHHKLTEEEICQEISKYEIDLSMPSPIPDVMPVEPFQELLQRVRQECYTCDPDPHYVSLVEKDLCVKGGQVEFVQQILSAYFGTDGPGLLVSLSKLPDSSIVGIYVAPTKRIDGFIDGVSKDTYLPPNLLIAEDANGTVTTTVGIGSRIQGQRPPDGITSEITLFELSTALPLLNDRAHPWVLGSLFAKDGYFAGVGEPLKPDGENLPSYISRGTVRCLIGRLVGMQKKKHPSLSWVSSFTHSLLQGTPDTSAEGVSDEEMTALMETQLSDVDLPDRIGTNDLFDEWTFKLRISMRR